MSTERPPTAWRGWVVCLVGAGVLTAFAAAAPAGVRKLVLFAIAYGVGIGGLFAFTARRFPLSRWAAQIVTPLLIIIGLSFVALRTHHTYQALQRAENQAHPERLTPSPMLEAIAANDPQTADMLRQQRAQADPDFLHYLAVRTRPLGEWGHPWPLAFWCGELFLAAVAGVLVATHLWPAVRRTANGHDGSTDSE